MSGIAEVAHRHGGQVVRTSVDGLVAAFEATAPALTAAVDMQVASSQLLRGCGIGVAAGDVSWDDAAVAGRPVVVATSLQSAATGGQILINEVVHLLARDQRDDHFDVTGPLSRRRCPARRGRTGWSGRPRRPSTQSARPDVHSCRSLRAPAAHAFVGRSDALAVLEKSWQLARSAGQVVLVGGEAGSARHGWPPSSPDWCTPTVPPSSSAAVTTTWPSRINRGCRSSTSCSRPSRSRSLRATRRNGSPLGPLIAHGEWLEPVGPPPDPESARYRLYEAFAESLRDRGALADSRCARGPALGRRADARPASPPHQVRAAGELACRHVPRHERRAHRSTCRLPGRPSSHRHGRPPAPRGARRRRDRTLRDRDNRPPTGRRIRDSPPSSGRAALGTPSTSSSCGDTSSPVELSLPRPASGSSRRARRRRSYPTASARSSAPASASCQRRRRG